MEHADEIIPILKSSLPFWEHLKETEKKTLSQWSQLVRYEKGGIIRCQNCECTGVLIIKSGSVRTFMLSEEGKEITLYRLEQGDVCVLSASCVLSAITFEVQMEAVTESEIIQISAGAYSEIVDRNIYAEAFTYKQATERFSDVMWTMQQILFMSFDQRLAIFLLDESGKTGSDDIHMTHEQIAKYTGSAREVVSRMLKYFSAEGLVKLSRGGVTILDKKGIKQLIS